MDAVGAVDDLQLGAERAIVRSFSAAKALEVTMRSG